MSGFLRGAPPARAGGLILCLMVLSGCGPGVREDRTITFAAGGDGAAFQHGRNGVFVTDPQGGAPKAIFQPGPGVTAVSPPRWSPDGAELVFRTPGSALA